MTIIMIILKRGEGEGKKSVCVCVYREAVRRVVLVWLRYNTSREKRSPEAEKVKQSR